MYYVETWQQVEDYLRARFIAETAPGGRLATIKTLAEVAPPEGAIDQLDFPILAWQYDEDDESFRTTQGNQQSASFTLALYARVAPTAGSPIPDPVKQVRAALKNLWNDRNGGGLGPVLRDDPTLNGLVIYSLPTKKRLLAGRAVNEAAGASGVYTVKFVTLAEFSGGVT